MSEEQQLAAVMKLLQAANELMKVIDKDISEPFWISFENHDYKFNISKKVKNER